MENSATVVFGPVPSRRLGRSLGINNIPPKVCSYACAYCQVGHTLHKRSRRRAFYAPEEIGCEVESRLEALARKGERVDYLSFVPDGEPTLDENLGRHIETLAKFKIPVAVITNSSLLCLPDTREQLAMADWISLKIDTVDKTVWQTLSRPHGGLDLDSILEGNLEGIINPLHAHYQSEALKMGDVEN